MTWHVLENTSLNIEIDRGNLRTHFNNLYRKDVTQQTTDKRFNYWIIQDKLTWISFHSGRGWSEEDMPRVTTHTLMYSGGLNKSTLEEIKKAIKKLRNYKTSGTNNISSEVCKIVDISIMDKPCGVCLSWGHIMNIISAYTTSLLA